MSYKGPPYPGQQPPISFGLPPGTPTAYPNLPTAFSGPQASSMYPTSYNSSMPQPSMPRSSSNEAPSPQLMYDPQRFQPRPQVYPGQHPQPQQPYQPQKNAHQLPHVPQVYPGQNPQLQQPYPPQKNIHQPPHVPQAYSGQHPQPQQPYPHQTNAHQPPHIPLNAAYGPSGGSMYPNLSPLSGSTPYPSMARDMSGSNVSRSSLQCSDPPIAKEPVKSSPTVFARDGFDPRADAEILRKAMKGFGTDEKAIIQVLANRTNAQRIQIGLQFKTLFGKDLIEDLKSETSGNFKKLLVAMMTPLTEYYARELHDAMDGIGTTERVLIELMCTLSNHEIRVIKQTYQSLFNKSLEDDLIGDTSGHFKRLMVSLCCANRDESDYVDQAAAEAEARQLYQAGENRLGTDESVFNSILVHKNYAQLTQIFSEYFKLTRHGLEEAIESEFSGDIKSGLLAIVKCVRNRPGFFAEQLYKSMKGLGTRDRDLIRLVVTRSEIDMGEIKQNFKQLYNESLDDFISDDTSGNYKRCLLALIN